MSNVSARAGLRRCVISGGEKDNFDTVMVEGVAGFTMTNEPEITNLNSGSNVQLASLTRPGVQSVTLQASQIPYQIYGWSGGSVIRHINTSSNLSYYASGNIADISEADASFVQRDPDDFFSIAPAANAESYNATPDHMSFMIEVTTGTADYTYESIKVYRLDGDYRGLVAGTDLPDAGLLNAKLVAQRGTTSLVSTGSVTNIPVSMGADGTIALLLNAFTAEEKATILGRFTIGGSGEVVVYYVSVSKTDPSELLVDIRTGSKVGKRPRVSVVAYRDDPSSGASSVIIAPQCEIAPLTAASATPGEFATQDIVFTAYPSNLLGGYAFAERVRVAGG